MALLFFFCLPRDGVTNYRVRDPFKSVSTYLFFFLFLVVKLFSFLLLGTVFVLMLLSHLASIYYLVLLGVLASVFLTFYCVKASLGGAYGRGLINYLLLKGPFFLLLLTVPLAGECTQLHVMVTATLMLLAYVNLRPSTGYLKFLLHIVYLLMALSVALSYLVYLDIEFDGHVLWGILYLWVMARVQELNWLNRLRMFFKNAGRGTIYILLFVSFNLVGSLFFLNVYAELISEASMESKDLFLLTCTQYWFNYCFFYAGALLTYFFIEVLSGAQLITENQRKWALILLCTVFLIYCTYLDWRFHTLLWDLLTSPPSGPRLFIAVELFFPLLLGTVNLLGLFAYPVATNYSVVLGVVASVLFASYCVKPSVGGMYHFGPEGVESSTSAARGGRPLSVLIALLETLGLLIKVISLTTRLVANLSAGHILTALFYGNGCPRGHLYPLKTFLLIFPVGLALLVLEVCVCYVQGYVFCTLMTEYWYGYTRARVKF